MKKDLVKKAIFALKNGEIICYPTDTLYGLGVDIKNDSAIKNLFDIKKRPFDFPISVACKDISSIEDIAYLSDFSKNVIKKFLPGKLSIILNKKDSVSDILTAGHDKISIRIPNNSTTLNIIKNFGPITCTSANIHGESTPNVINEINMLFKNKISVYIDEGVLSDKPSTIIDLSSDEIKILRKGSISKKEIMAAIENE